MTNEEKQLLLKDLCARLPYGVMYATEYGPRIINDLFIYSNGPVYTDHGIGDYNEVYGIELENIKPYLRPMLSMTEKEIKEYWKFVEHRKIIYDNGNYDGAHNILRLDIPNRLSNYIDWLNSHHFDYRGLIPMGLALEAKEGMYKTE